jgi:hypothetical protein
LEIATETSGKSFWTELAASSPGARRVIAIVVRNEVFLSHRHFVVVFFFVVSFLVVYFVGITVAAIFGLLIFFLKLLLGWLFGLRLFVTVVVIVIARAATHLRGRFLDDRYNVMISEAFTLDAKVVNDIAESNTHGADSDSNFKRYRAKGGLARLRCETVGQDAPGTRG